MIFVTSIRLTFSSSKYNERQKTLTDFSVDSINPKQRLFPIITDYFSLFSLLFSIMTGRLYLENGNVQPAILDPLTGEWLISVNEEGSINWIYHKARIQKGKQPDAVFQDYYTHCLNYYTHYFSRLTRIAVAVSTSYALQIYVYRFCVLHQAKGTSGKLPLPSEAPKLLCFGLLLSLYHYYFNYFLNYMFNNNR